MCCARGRRRLAARPGGLRFRYENHLRDAGRVRGWVRVRACNPGYLVRLAR